ncbi:MAG TPA: TolC family outer membrane protein [Roseiarcus sp.]|nr:TolC family outer membrane protein [Roseiarcus sp.]
MGQLFRAARDCRRLAARGAVFATIAAFTASPAGAETLAGALAKAYLNNPDINQQRAGVRASDENVPKANAGFLPTINGQASYGFSDTQFNAPGQSGSLIAHPRGFGVTATENLWNGNRTINGVRQAESSVLASREQLRNTEQNVLLNAVTFYMNVLRDSAILSLNRANVDVLKEQLRNTQDRFNVGEVTKTDVAQAQASLAGAEAQALSAQSTLQSSIASYRQTVGDQPKSLAPVKPLERLLPRSLQEAIAIGLVEHPAIVAALHGVDAAELNVKIVEGALLPTLSAQLQVADQWDSAAVATIPNHVINATATAQLTIPIYQGGSEYASTRQAKEQLTQQELQVAQQRDAVRAAVTSAWWLFSVSPAVIRSSKAQVDAAAVALAGVREEAKVGQRTTLDVLNAQQALLNARVQLVSAEHDQVVASYALLSAIGRLSTANLGVAVAQYDPRVHFDQVKDKWIGLRTPDGK